MYKVKIVIIATIIATAILAAASLWLPVAPDWQHGWLLFHLRIIIALCIPALHVIAALFFLLGLQGFQQSLRRAYALVAISIVLFGLCLLASPMVTLFDLWDSWMMTYGVVNIPFFIPVLVLSFALAVFFESLNIASLWRKLWFNGLVALGFLAVVVISPHKESALPELTYDIGNAMFALSSVGLFIIGVKLLIIRKHLTETYARVLMWLAVGVLAESAVVSSSIIVKAIGLDPRSLASLQDIMLLAALPFMRAGYLFYQLTADTRKMEEPRLNASAVEVVMYVSALASNVREVDPILDELRKVTSRMQNGTPLSEADQRQLGQVYLQLEDYLEHKERHRSFTKQQLRQLVYRRFNVATSPDKIFWEQLPPLS